MKTFKKNKDEVEAYENIPFESLQQNFFVLHLIFFFLLCDLRCLVRDKYENVSTWTVTICEVYIIISI
jgi:uncharacterized membrane protein YagU involved in acid resistance